MELWDLYTEKRECTGETVVRGEQLPEKRFHLCVQVWIVNSKGEYVISQRSADRPSLPLKWECVGGSVVAGENSIQGAIREVKEEVGIDLSPEEGRLVYSEIRKEKNDIRDIWIFNFDGAIELEKAVTDEVAQSYWMKPEKIRRLLESGEMVQSLSYFEEKIQGVRPEPFSTAEKIRARLFFLQDRKYGDFHAKLIPDLEREKIIGVRTPALRKLAKELAKKPEAQEFLAALPHSCYEENNLHGFLVETVKDFDDCLRRLEQFLPYVDNWATCDQVSPKALGKQKEKLLEAVRRWLASERTYTIRYGVNMLMTFFLEEEFKPEQPEWVAEIRSKEYYVQMAVAWYFATVLAKQYEAVIPFLENGRLDPWVHNKTIQKARESYRITEEQKEYLKTLKRKGV